jgi:hypothetical protein
MVADLDVVNLILNQNSAVEQELLSMRENINLLEDVTISDFKAEGIHPRTQVYYPVSGGKKC